MELNDEHMKCLKAFFGGGYTYIDSIWEIDFLAWGVNEYAVKELVQCGYIAKPMPDYYALTRLGVEAVLPLMGNPHKAPKAQWDTPKKFGYDRWSARGKRDVDDDFSALFAVGLPKSDT